MEKYLKQEEVATILGSSERYVYELRKKGKLNGVKVAGKWLYRQTDLEDYLEKEFQKCNKK